MRAFLYTCRETFGRDERYQLYLRTIDRLGGPNDAALPVFTGATRDRVVRKLREEALALGLNLFDSGAAGGGVCYASAANSFVIRSTGEVAKCTVALSHPRNRLGRLHEDGRVELDNDKLRGWLRGLLAGDPDVAGCPMRGFADVASPSSPLVVGR